MTWFSLAKTRGDSRIVAVNGSVKGNEFTAGLIFVREGVRNSRLTLRCRETGEKIRVRLTDEMKKMGLPNYFLKETLEVSE